MKNRIVITGATGFLGRNLVRLFLERGYQVCAVVRPDSPQQCKLPSDSKLQLVFSDMKDILAAAKQIGSADAWFHFAWRGVNREEIDSPVIQKQNIEDSLKCMQAARISGSRVFMDAGSRVEYGVTDQIMSEDLPCYPVNQYGKAKLEFYQKAASLSQEYGLNYYHLRFFSVYGYGDHPWSIISTLLHRLSTGEVVSLSDCCHKWNFMHIIDAVEAVYQLYIADRGNQQGTIINIAGTDTRVLKSFTEEIKLLIGGSGELQYGTFQQAKEGAVSIQPDITRLISMTNGNWKEQFSFREGILETLKKETENQNEENQHFNSML